MWRQACEETLERPQETGWAVSKLSQARKQLCMPVNGRQSKTVGKTRLTAVASISRDAETPHALLGRPSGDQ